jgi:hypothetical protein
LKKSSSAGRDFFTKLGPQITLPPVPIFGVNKQITKSRGVGWEAIAVASFGNLFAMDLLDLVLGVVAAT